MNLPPREALDVAERSRATPAGDGKGGPLTDATAPRRRFAESLVSSLRHLRRPDVSKEAFLDEALAAADEYAAALIEQQMRSPYAVRPPKRGGDAA